MNTAVATPPGPEATPPPATAWRAYAGVSAAGPVDEKELVERYLPLVRNVVDRIKLTLPAHIDVADLYSVGYIGLVAAVRKYDPAQCATFAGYASLRIRGAVLDELRRLDWCPRRVRARASKLKETVNALEQRLGRSATEDEIAAELGISRREYDKWLDEVRPATFVALDRSLDGEEGEGATLQDVLCDENDVTGRETLEREELLKLLTQKMAEMPDIPRKVLAMYYFEGMRLAEIAAVFGVTESRVCQIHSQAIVGLRAFLSQARNR